MAQSKFTLNEVSVASFASELRRGGYLSVAGASALILNSTYSNAPVLPAPPADADVTFVRSADADVTFVRSATTRLYVRTE